MCMLQDSDIPHSILYHIEMILYVQIRACKKMLSSKSLETINMIKYKKLDKYMGNIHMMGYI